MDLKVWLHNEAWEVVYCVRNFKEAPEEWREANLKQAKKTYAEMKKAVPNFRVLSNIKYQCDLQHISYEYVMNLLNE